MVLKTTISKIANFVLLLWFIFFSLCILLADRISFAHAPRWVFNAYSANYKYAPVVMFILLIFSSFTFIKKAFLSLAAGLGMIVLIFVAEILFPSLYKEIANSGESTVVWLALFFTMKCVVIAVIFFVLAGGGYIFKKFRAISKVLATMATMGPSEKGTP